MLALDVFEGNVLLSHGGFLVHGLPVVDSEGLVPDDALISLGRISRDTEKHLGFVGERTCVNKADVQLTCEVGFDRHGGVVGSWICQRRGRSCSSVPQNVNYETMK